MEINVNDEMKMVDVWLTNADKSDPAVQAKLKALYAHYKQKKYMVATFLSGNQPLQPSISDLLRYNRRRSAEAAVQKAKGDGMSAGVGR